MGSLVKLATWALVEARGAGRVRAAAIRMGMLAACAAFAAILALGALGCAAAALWSFALPSLGPVGAPLVVAAALLVVAAIVVATTWLATRDRRTKPAPAAGPPLLMAEATRLFNGHKGVVLLAAVVAGMVAANGGRKP